MVAFVDTAYIQVVMEVVAFAACVCCCLLLNWDVLESQGMEMLFVVTYHDRLRVG